MTLREICEAVACEYEHGEFPRNVQCSGKPMKLPLSPRALRLADILERTAQWTAIDERVFAVDAMLEHTEFDAIDLIEARTTGSTVRPRGVE